MPPRLRGASHSDARRRLTETLPHSFALLSTLAVALGIALVFGLVALRLRLPAIVGYLLAGVVIGPFTPGFIADLELSQQLAEVGVILLMFGVGLHFSFKDLMAVRRIAIPGALAQIAAATALGAAVAWWWGWSLGGAVVLGLALSVASTVVLIRALEARNLFGSLNGRIAVGWLVVEDLAMVLVLVLLPPLSGWLGGAPPPAVPDRPLWLALILTLASVAGFIVLMLVVGRRVFPWLLGVVARSNSRELFTLCVIAVAVGIAYGSATLFGVSFALGAFFAGVVMNESDLSQRAAAESLPLREAFAVLFFVSVGMLFNPSTLVEQPLHVLVVVAIILLGKSIVAFALVLAFRYPLNTALTVSAGLAQIGEFSFILASLGVQLGLLPSEGQDLILAGALLSIALNPVLFYWLEPARRWVLSRSRMAVRLEHRDDPLSELPGSFDEKRLTGHVVLVGYGRVGRRIGEALTERGISFVVAEQNREVVEALRAKGMAAVSGDASEAAVLIQAHIARAGMLVVAAPDAFRVRQMIEIARKLNPRIDAVVRTHSDDEREFLERAQVGRVFMGEHELALGMTGYVLERFGVAPRERH